MGEPRSRCWQDAHRPAAPEAGAGAGVRTAGDRTVTDRVAVHRDGDAVTGASTAPTRADDGAPDKLPGLGVGLREGVGRLATADGTDRQPLQLNNLGQREYATVIKAAGVKRIKFHGLRHTRATLLLQARTPVHVVSERLGHSKVEMTLEIYAHVLPDMQREAADTIGALLSGKVR